MSLSGAAYFWKVLNALDLEYAVSNPAVRHQAPVFGQGSDVPVELLECTQEESSVAMAHGYAKIEGRPMAVLLDGALGLKHASMAIYNAYADRVPMILFAACSSHDRTPRNDSIAEAVVEIIKWSSAPKSVSDFGRSAARAYSIAMMPPMGPTLIVVDPHVLDSWSGGDLPLPGIPVINPPAAQQESLREIAKILVGAERPLILAQRAARTAEGMSLLVELAELLGSPVMSWDRMNFPGRHPLAGSGGDSYKPDVVLALEVDDVDRQAKVAMPERSAIGRARACGARFLHISSVSLKHERNLATRGAYAGELDRDIAADAQSSLAALLEECGRALTSDGSRAGNRRAAAVAGAHRDKWRLASEEASRQWNRNPVSPARLCGELWPLIQQEDWSLVSWQGSLTGWPIRLWDFDRHYRYIGASGASGLGYGPGAAAGAALANWKHGRLSINIQSDGDLMYAPGMLETIARYRIPLLTIMHNNRSYHAEVDAWRARAIRSNRDPDRSRIATALDDPAIDYAGMARSMGMHAEGPIADPGELGTVFARGIERVKQGEPVLIDVLTQPR